MSVENGEEHRRALERFYAAFNARDLPAILAELHPEIEFQSRFAQIGGAVYRGHDGVRGWLEDLAQAWEHIEVELGRTHESGTDSTIALITLHAKGRASGLELHEPAAHDLRWQDGKLARLAYTDRDDAELAQSPEWT